jgi:hypothetical protein
MARLLAAIREAFHRSTVWTWLLLGVTALGFLLRIEHALTFDHVNRGSDYSVHLQGVRWMQGHWRPFFCSLAVEYQVRSYPPLWYFLSAIILSIKDNERLLSALSIVGFGLRQLSLWLVLRSAIPQRRLGQLGAMAIHAVLPLAVLIDGKVNPEGLHSGIFAVGIYALWRIERTSRSIEGVRWSSALLFGAAAGLALLVKSTGVLLVAIGAAVFGLHSLRWLLHFGWRAAWRRVVVRSLAAAAVWAALAGFWVGTNLVKFHHPIPHVWDLETAATNPILAEPLFYRRPLGWALPFEWQQYWRFPLLRSESNPRPNFWAAEITGTWSDIYNRGFCRLKGGPFTDSVWGGREGLHSDPSDVWNVYLRCSRWMASLLHVGVWLTLAAVVALGWCGWQQLRSFGVRGSLVLSGVPVLCTLSFMWFALAYPWDDSAVLNPRYLLSQAMPMSACLGLALAALETVAKRNASRALAARAVILTTLGLIAVVGVMVVYERFGA